MLLEGEQSIGLELVDFIDTGREQHGKAVHIQCRSDTACSALSARPNR